MFNNSRKKKQYCSYGKRYLIIILTKIGSVSLINCLREAYCKWICLYIEYVYLIYFLEVHSRI